MNKHFTLPALSAAALLLPSCAQILQAAAPPVIHDPSKVPAGTYTVDPAHTQILFSVLHMGFTNYYGNFSGASGSLSVAPKKPASMAVNISVPTASISTTVPKLTEELKGGNWLDVARFPTMVFRSQTVTQTGPTTADIAGTLTLHGLTKPLTLHATFVGGGMNMLDHKQTVGFQLTGTVKRSEFDVSNYVPLISDDVPLTIAAAFEKS